MVVLSEFYTYTEVADADWPEIICWNLVGNLKLHLYSDLILLLWEITESRIAVLYVGIPGAN